MRAVVMAVMRLFSVRWPLVTISGPEKDLSWMNLG